MKKIVLFFGVIIVFLTQAFTQETGDIKQKIFSPLAVIKYNTVDIGNGFCVGKNLVVTTISTIGKYANGQVMLSNGKHYNILGFVASDATNDLVLLQIDYDSASAATIANTPSYPEQDIYLIDRSDETNFTFSEGKIKETKDFGDVRLLKIFTTKPFKNTGTPVYNTKGEVVGISIFLPLNDPEISFAIPAESIERLLSQKGGLRKLYLLQPSFENIKKRKLSDMDKSKAVTELLDQGIARYNAKDYNGAIEKFNLALRLNPNDADVLVFRGQAKYMLMQYKDALEDFNKAIDLQPEYAEAYDLRGICKAELGDKEGACQDWRISFEKGFDPAFKLLEKFCDLEKMK